MPGKRVPVLAPDPETGRLRFATVDESEIGIVTKAGGRALTKAEGDAQEAEQRQAVRREKAGVSGTVSDVVGAVGGALNPLMYSGGAGSTGEAFNKGVQSGMSAGLADAGVRQGLERVAPGTGHKYAQQVDDIRLASPTAHAAGEIAGMAAGTALPVSPAGMIGRAGAVAERGASLVMRGAEGGGALARGLSTGGKMAIRGGVEAGLYGATQEAAREILHDEEISGEKLYSAAGHHALAGAVLGGGLGFTGSLAASGARAARDSVVKSMSRMAGEEGGQGSKLAQVFDGTGAKKLSNELAVDALGATKVQARSALEHVKGGADAVGEYVNRVAIRPSGHGGGIVGGSLKAGVSGHPDDILAAIKADKYGRIATGLGESVGSTPAARLEFAELKAMVDTQHASMMTDPTKIAGADAFRQRIATELSALGHAGKVQGAVVDEAGNLVSGKISAADLYYTRAALERQAYEVSRTSGAAGEAYKGFLRQLDERIVTSIDDAAKTAGKSGVGDQIRHWKREWQLASAAESMAEAGAERYGHNNIFGIRESIGAATALASGHPIGAAGTLVGGKVARERGAAAAAYALGQISDRQVAARMLRQSEAAASKAAIGVLRDGPTRPVKAAPVKAPAAKAADVATAKQETADLRQKASSIVEWIGEVRANPTRLQDALAEASAIVGRAVGPRAAMGYSEAGIKAIAFVAKYVPEKDRRDPLDPRSVPPLTYDEADRLVRAHTYATEPSTIWRDFGQGKITPEGLDAAQELQPRQLEKFRMELLEHVTEHLLQNKQLSQSARLRIDKLLGMPAGADLRPETIARLQANFEGAPPEPAGPTPDAKRGGPVSMQIQQSGFDSVEARRAR